MSTVKTTTTSTTNSTKQAPTPQPRPERSTQSGSSVPTPTPRPDVDRSSVSSEAREATTDSASPVNFDSWDEGSTGDAAGKTPNLGEGTLRKGAQGEQVKELQSFLNEKLGLDLDVDGKFGPKTLDAVKKFQAASDLEVDGIVGPKTRGAILGGEAAGTQPEPVGEGGIPADEAGAATNSEIPGLSDTGWTDKLPPNLKKHAQAFLDAGEKYEIDPRFLAAISMQETGGGRSSAFRNKNNAMGIMGKNGLRSFNSVADSINSQAHSMTRPNGYYTGKHTIGQIGATYAPVGASNDPNGLNNHWVKNVSRFFAEFGGDPSARVTGF